MHYLERIKTTFPKVRQSNLENDNDSELINYLVVLLNLKTTNNVDNDNLQVQMLVVLDFIKSKFGFLTTEEIKEAFKKYVAGDFAIKVFRILDSIVVADVLNAYIDYRAEIIRTHGSKKTEEIMPISEEEKKNIIKNSINDRYNFFLENNEVQDPILHIFSFLVENKKIQLPSEKTKNYYDKKILEATEQIKNENTISVSDKKERLKMKEILNSIINNDLSLDAKNKIEIRAKKLIIIDFFNNQKEKGILNIF